MKVARVVTAVMALALLVPASAVSAGRGPGDVVAAGGWRLLDGNPIAAFDLGASAGPDGSDPRGSYFFARDGAWFSATVTCLRADGDRAVVGGSITDGNIEGAIGFLLWLDDGGQPAGGQPGPDAVSFTLVSGVGDPAWPDVDDVPTTCPSIDLPDGVEWRAVEGNVNVIDR
jgi:hypothetical protein